MPDDQLESRLQGLASTDRRVLVVLLTYLGEFDARKLYADRGYPSIFAYCVEVLRYSEQGAYKRIQAARAARKFPALLRYLADGRINLKAAVVLAPHLTNDNFEERVGAAIGKTTRELEKLAAEWPSRLATPALFPEQPLGSTVFKFPADASLGADFLRATELLPGKPIEAIFARALTFFLDRIDPLRRREHRRRKTTERSRRIPRALRDAVWKRDEGRCTFTQGDGPRCSARKYLEIDHIQPYALGGSSDDPANLRLACRAHNQFYARQIFGRNYPRG